MNTEWLDDIQAAGNATLTYWSGRWVYAACENRSIVRRYLATKKLVDIVNVPKVTKAPAYLLSSGPSLDDIPWDQLVIRQTEGAGIFASSSDVVSVLANGITPNYVVVVDANPSIAHQVAGVLDMLQHTTLLCSPLVEPKLIRSWPGPIAMFRPLQHGDEFVTSILPKMYSTRIEIDSTHTMFLDWLTAAFLNAGCVSNTMLLAAAFLGYDPVFMIGNDLGYPAGKARCTTYTRSGDGSFTPDPPAPLLCRELLRTATNGVRTTSEFLHYKLNLFIAWRLTPIRLFNCSPGGIIHPDEIPFIDVEAACGDIEGTIEGLDGTRVPSIAPGWEWAANTYPMEIGSKAWSDHMAEIAARMGMLIRPIKGGFQIQPLSDAPGIVVPLVSVTSTGAPHAR